MMEEPRHRIFLAIRSTEITGPSGPRRPLFSLNSQRHESLQAIMERTCDWHTMDASTGRWARRGSSLSDQARDRSCRQSRIRGSSRADRPSRRARSAERKSSKRTQSCHSGRRWRGPRRENEEGCIRRAEAQRRLPRPCRPAGYNPVELSRFAVGIHPLVFQSPAPALSERVLAIPSASPANAHLPSSPPPSRSPLVFRDAAISTVFARLFRLGTGIPRSASHDGRFADQS